MSIMSASRPIICEVDEGSELESIVCENKCGICIKPDDYISLANSILELYNNKELLINMGENSRKYVEDNITRAISTKKILDAVVQVENEGRSHNV